MHRIAAEIGKAVCAQSAVIKKLVVAFASGGHVLLDDVPGTGKTTLAKALSKVMSLTFQRVQFTPDLLPADILGVSVFNQHDQAFVFHEGPIFADVLLADEINRASPRTQSALLEAMAERQVSIDGQQRQLPPLFFVIATQNPLEFQGTYALPESQMDRFAMRLSLGFVSPADEVRILDAQDHHEHPLQQLQPLAGLAELNALHADVAQVAVSAEVKGYIVEIVGATRAADGVVHGASARASLALMKAAQALAQFDGLDFVTPDHVQSLAEDVIAHRLVLNPQARHGGLSEAQVMHDILDRVRVPV
jgi:MoxR-like ATPase